MSEHPFRIVLDLGGPGDCARGHPGFDILVDSGAATGTRIFGDFHRSLEEFAARWEQGIRNPAFLVLWLFPESGLFRNYCLARGEEPKDSLLSLLSMSDDLNRRYGPGSVMIQWCGELDSCYIDFPADWSTRESCYRNWERFNTTDLHFHRYRLFGYKGVWGDMPEDYPIRDPWHFAWEHGMSLSDMPVEVCCNRAFDLPHNARWGWPHILVENYCGTTWNTHLLTAYARGASIGHGCGWAADFSPWGHPGGKNESMYARDGRWLDGITASLLLRGWMSAFLSGSEYVEQEACLTTHFVVDPDPEKDRQDPLPRTIGSADDLSPVGHAAVRFADYAIRRHPGRGVPYRPYAILVDSRCGWNVIHGNWFPAADAPPPAPPDPGIAPYQVWFGRIPSRPPDWMVGAFFRTAFDAEPIHGGLNGLDADGSPEKAEEGMYLGRARWGDTFDVFDESIGFDTLASYKAVILLGVMPGENAALWPVLERYLRNGGILLANACQVPAARQAWFGAQWDLVPVDGAAASDPSSEGLSDDMPCEVRNLATGTAVPWSSRHKRPPRFVMNPYGLGESWLCTTPWSVTSSSDLEREMTALMDRIHERTCPVRVQGESTHWMANRLEDGWLVSVFNHFEGPWCGTLSVEGARPDRELWMDAGLEGDASVHVEVPAYEFRVFKFSSSQEVP